MGRTLLKVFRRYPPRHISQQDASNQFESYLRKGGCSVVLHPKELEAGGQRQWIAGKANQRGISLAVAYGEGILAVQEQVPGNSAVNERVAIDLKEVPEHPDSEHCARDDG